MDVPGELLAAGRAWYAEHADALGDEMERNGADASTVGAVLADYRDAVTGYSCGISIKRDQLQAALDASSTAAAYDIDKLGFFITVAPSYGFISFVAEQYQANVKEQPDAKKRGAYFDAITHPRAFHELTAGALEWLRITGQIAASDFAGIEQEQIGRFLSFIDTFADNCAFCQYVYFARRALNATPEQLGRLTPPPMFQDDITAALNYADFFADEYEKMLASVSDVVQQADEEKPTTAATSEPLKIAIPPKIAALGSRSLYAALDAKKNGDRTKNILPIDAIIEDYCQKNPDKLPVTRNLVETAVQGVNLLQQIQNIPPKNGEYLLETNISEFAGLCGFRSDANETEKQKLITALSVLSGVYCVIWTPRGQVAQQIMNLREIGLTGAVKGRLLLSVPETAVTGGRPQLIGRDELLKFKEIAQSAPGRHFRNQILSKGHKDEDNLLVEVFSYDAARAMAERSGDAAQVEAVKTYQKNHKARDRARLQKMFEKAQAAGLITFKREQSKTGKYVYTWERVNPPTADELAAAEQAEQLGPDEQ